MRKRTYPRLRMADLPALGRSSVPSLTAASWRDDFIKGATADPWFQGGELR